MDFKFLIIMFMAVLLVGTVSALEVDNTYEYDPITREATFYNTFLGIKTTEIGKARLDSALNVKVGTGYRNVGNFTLWAYEDYNNALRPLKIKNMRTKNDVSRVADYVVIDRYDEVEVPIYKTVCSELYSETNQTYYNSCESVENGSYTRLEPVYKKVTPADLKKNDFIQVQIWADVKAGDYMDWRPTIFYEEVVEWATWTEDLNTDLVSYFKLDESTGNVIDSQGSYDGTNVGATPGQTGILGDAYDFDGINDRININNVLTGAGSSTVGTWNAWVKVADTTPSGFTMVMAAGDTNANENMILYIDSGGSVRFQLYDGGDREIYLVTTSTTLLTADTWQMLTITQDGTTPVLYVNGVAPAQSFLDESGKGKWFDDCAGIDNFRIGNGNWNNGGEATFFDGSIDEVSIFDVAITPQQVSDLWNSGDGITWTDDFDNDQAPNITLNSPSSANYTSHQNIQIDLTVYDDINLTDVKLYVNDVLNQTNASGINNTNYLFNVTLGDGDYTIYGKATDNESQTSNSSSIRIVIDSIAPSISLTPVSDIVYAEAGDNLTINWTVNDTHLDSCWYNVNGTNESVNCSSNGVVINVSSSSIDSVSFWANDTFGNLAYAYDSWEYTLFLESIGYNAVVYETGSEEISLNLSYDISTLAVSAVLEYDNTNYTSIKSVGAYGAYFYRTFDIPIGADGENKTFKWHMDISGALTNTTETDEYIQTINEIYLGYCDANYSVVGAYFNYFDEDSGAAINAVSNPTTYEGVFNYWIGTGTEKKNFTISDFNVSNSTYPICVSPHNNSNNIIKTDLDLRFGATDYLDNSHYLRNASLNNETTNITLWLLPETVGTKFFITAYYGIDALDTAVITSSKYFEGEGVHKSTGVSLTDGSGKFTQYLDEDKSYIFTAVKDGEYLGAVTKSAICETAPCELTLQFIEDSSDLMTGYSGAFADNVDGEITYNKTSKLVTAIFTDTTGTASYFRLDVKLVSLNNTDTTVCDTTLYTTAGAITCNMSGYNGNYQARLYISRSPEKIVDYLQFVIGGLADSLGTSGLIVSLVFLILIVFSGFKNPVIAVALVPFALVVEKLMGILQISWLWIGGACVLALLIIGRMKT